MQPVCPRVSQQNCLLPPWLRPPRPKVSERRSRRRRPKAVDDKTIHTSDRRYVGLKVHPRARNVLGTSVDGLLAKRLGSQSLTIKSMILDNTERLTKDHRKGLFNGCENDLAHRTKGQDRNIPWTKALLPVSFRRLVHLGTQKWDPGSAKQLKRDWVRFGPNMPKRARGKHALYDATSATAWLSGIVAFHVDDYWTATLHKYVGRMSNSSLCFVKTPTRSILREFVSRAIQGKIRYVNIFGSANSKNLELDPLLHLFESQIVQQGHFALIGRGVKSNSSRKLRKQSSDSRSSFF